MPDTRNARICARCDGTGQMRCLEQLASGTWGIGQKECHDCIGTGWDPYSWPPTEAVASRETSRGEAPE